MDYDDESVLQTILPFQLFFSRTILESVVGLREM